MRLPVAACRSILPMGVGQLDRGNINESLVPERFMFFQLRPPGHQRLHLTFSSLGQTCARRQLRACRLAQQIEASVQHHIVVDRRDLQGFFVCAHDVAGPAGRCIGQGHGRICQNNGIAKKNLGPHKIVGQRPHVECRYQRHDIPRGPAKINRATSVWQAWFEGLRSYPRCVSAQRICADVLEHGCEGD